MRCPECGHMMYPDKFPGCPVSMWYEIYEYLQNHSTGKESPLNTLSRINERR